MPEPEKMELWVKRSYVSAAFKAVSKRVPHGYTDSLSEFVREIVALSVSADVAATVAAKTIRAHSPITGAAVQQAIAKREAGEHVPDILSAAKTIQEANHD